MDALHAEAASNRGISDVEDSPYTYSNVSYRRLDGDRVALEFRRHDYLSTVESVRAPLAREVVAQSLLNPASVGERSESDVVRRTVASTPRPRRPCCSRCAATRALPYGSPR
jgi:hypothetical protein